MQQRLPITIEARTPDPAQAGKRDTSGTEDWRLDDRTRRVGLRGLARARAALDASGTDQQASRADAA